MYYYPSIMDRKMDWSLLCGQPNAPRNDGKINFVAFCIREIFHRANILDVGGGRL